MELLPSFPRRRVHLRLTLLSCCLLYVTAEPSANDKLRKVTTTKPAQNYKADLGSCVCDLTVDVCDYNCCCDKDCTQVELAAFKGGCLHNATSGSQNELFDAAPFCSQFLWTVNRKDTINVNTRKNAAGSLCVVKINNPIQGFFYEDPGVADVNAAFNEQFQTAVYQYTEYVGNAAWVTPSTPYQYGDPIQLRFTNLNNAAGTFSLPTALSSGACSNYDATRFLVDTKSTCTRTNPSLSNLCSSGTVLDPKYYLSQLRFLSDPSKSTLITPKIASVQLSDISTGSRTNICYDSNKALKTCGTGTSSDFSALINDVSNIALPSPRVVNGVCNQALVGITFTFTYDPSVKPLSISGVLVDLTYASFDVGSTATSIAQTFEAKFVPTTNLSPIQKSGNPGYIVGAPVLVGTLTQQSGKLAILFSPNAHYGLTLPRMLPSLTCTSAADKMERQPVVFGEDMISGCVLYYSYNQLTNGCGNIRTEAWNYLTGGSSVTHVGKFGNASYLNAWDWVKIINDPPSDLQSGTTAPQNGICPSVLTSLEIQFLWADFGSTSNPQPGIIGARMNYVSGSLKYSCANSADCSSANKTQPFEIRTIVSWVKVSDQRAREFVPPAPRLIPPIPDDVFYPFKLGSSSDSRQGWVPESGFWAALSLSLVAVYMVGL